ncbi:hypothetical protein FQN60_018564 [Etheostoma spectabile]|uniref:CUE domain-containing protein n=1 Tax=Etheostoma spectabile TaxID=54343 RepID=A0A5J5DIP6_9PERO|nr:hypothetical protein FQN60_018564 [Etheostoma spectabile]
MALIVSALLHPASPVSDVTEKKRRVCRKRPEDTLHSASEAVESKQKSTSGRDVQLEHRRVNSAFLDKLEGRGSEKKTKEEAVWEAERPFMSTKEDTPRNQLPVVHLNPDPEQSYYDWTDEAGLEPDVDWALMRLMSSFPDFSKVFLEDILDQCNGDYDQAYTLLNN